MIKSNILYNSMIQHEFKVKKITSHKIINFLVILQNNCLKRIYNVYKTILIAKFKIKIHISFINIYLNKLQIKTKQKFQNSKHYERIEKKIHRMLNEKRDKHRKSKYISTNSKKAWLRNLNDFIEKQKTINT